MNAREKSLGQQIIDCITGGNLISAKLTQDEFGFSETTFEWSPIAEDQIEAIINTHLVRENKVLRAKVSKWQTEANELRRLLAQKIVLHKAA